MIKGILIIIFIILSLYLYDLYLLNKRLNELDILIKEDKVKDISTLKDNDVMIYVKRRENFVRDIHDNLPYSLHSRKRMTRGFYTNGLYYVINNRFKRIWNNGWWARNNGDYYYMVNIRNL